MEHAPQYETNPEWKLLENHEFNKNNFYRIVNEQGYKDYIEAGTLRSSPTGTESNMVGQINLGNRPTSFPSFDKGTPNLTYIKEGEENYIFETDVQLFARGDINPVTNQPIKGRHWAYRMIDPETGENLDTVDSSHIKNIYRVDTQKNLYVRG
ncbi:MAG: hypothetical protein V4686_02455 [Patescibacteria group bacterium]